MLDEHTIGPLNGYGNRYMHLIVAGFTSANPARLFLRFKTVRNPYCIRR